VTLQALVAQLFERGNAMQTFWGFYITVSLGLVVFFGNAKHSPRLPVLAGIVSIAFLGFAAVNCSGMSAVAAQRCFLFGQLDHFIPLGQTAGTVGLDASLAEGLKMVATPPTPDETKWFHIGCDVAVLCAIWFLTLWSPKKTTTPSNSK